MATGLIHIRRTFYRGQFGPPKNKESERTIPMGRALTFVLKKHERRVKPSAQGLVFPNAAGKAYEPGNLVRCVLWPVLEVLKLPRTGWRAFRRSVATTLSELREPVRTAQQVLGHSSPQTTLAFHTQSFVESQRRAVGRLEKLMFPVDPKFGSGAQLNP